MESTSSQHSKVIQPNYSYVIISVALVLFLMGSLTMLIFQANQLVADFKERLIVMVEFTPTNNTKDISKVQEHIRTQYYYKQNSLKFSSKEEVLTEMSDEFGEDLVKLDMPNPFRDILTFNVNANFLHADSLAIIQESLQSLPEIQEVHFPEILADKVAKNIKKISYITLGVTIFFIFVALTLIHNTVRLALYSQRFLIKNMQLVGAKWNFISRPFLRRAVFHGVLSGILASGAIVGVVRWINFYIPELRLLSDWKILMAVGGILVFTGVVINWISTFRVVRKYLKMRVDDLY